MQLFYATSNVQQKAIDSDPIAAAVGKIVSAYVGKVPMLVLMQNDLFTPL